MFDFMKASGKRDSIQGEEKSKFEAARNEVQALSLQAEAHTPVTRVSEKGKFLKIGSHKVTGKELNDIAAHIDNSTIQVRNVQIETLRHVDQLYQALDALDAEHIAGILTATEAAEKAKDLANVNDQNIGKIISYLTQDNRILTYRKEQESKVEALERKVKVAYIVAGSATAVAFISLITCLVTLL